MLALTTASVVTVISSMSSIIKHDHQLPNKLKSRIREQSIERLIFISYRRIDSRDFTRKIYDLLAEHFGHETVFRDLDSITAGVPFKEYIEDGLSQCEVLIAVIGPMWLQIADSAGRPRLDNPKDWVRLEIEFALERGIPVIPLLINDTKMPEADNLPGLLKALPTRHAARIRNDSQLKYRDVSRLIYDIESFL